MAGREAEGRQTILFGRIWRETPRTNDGPVNLKKTNNLHIHNTNKGVADVGNESSERVQQNKRM